MKSLAAPNPLLLVSSLLAVIGLLAGCATTPQVDWTARLGEYTYDQAVVELGPPTSQAKLGDGKTMAEWVTRSPNSTNLGVGVGGYAGGNVAVGSATSYNTGFRERVLRLTFSQDGKLENYQSNY